MFSSSSSFSSSAKAVAEHWHVEQLHVEGILLKANLVNLEEVKDVLAQVVDLGEVAHQLVEALVRLTRRGVLDAKVPVQQAVISVIFLSDYKKSFIKNSYIKNHNKLTESNGRVRTRASA